MNPFSSGRRWAVASWVLPGLLIGIAAVLRLWALPWGLPLKYAHIDESVVVFYSLRVVGGDPNPGFFDYPSFFLYLLAAVFRLALWIAPYIGWRGIDVAQAYLQGDGSFFTLTARLLNAGLSVLTVLWTYQMGRKWGGLFVGVLSAGLLAVNPVHVLHSHYGTVDVAALLLSLVALDRVLEYWETQKPRTGFWAAFCIGLATATKYYPAALGLLLIPAPFILRQEKARTLSAAFLLLCAAGFALGSPYAFLAPSAFVQRFAHLFPRIFGGNMAETHLFLPTLRGLLRNAGPLVFCAGGIGFIQVWRSADRVWKVLATAFGVLLVFFSLWKIQSEHYSLLLYPLMFLLAARALLSLRKVHRVLPWAAGLLMIGLCVKPTIRELRVLSTPDTRLTALSWIRSHIPPGSRLLRFAHTPEFSPKDPFQVQVDWENKRLWEEAQKDRRSWLENFRSFDYIVYSSYAPQEDRSLASLQGAFPLTMRVQSSISKFPHHPSVFIFKKE